MIATNNETPVTLLKLRNDYEVEIFNKQIEIKNNEVQLNINRINKEINKYECFLIMIDLAKKSNCSNKSYTEALQLEINNNIKTIDDKLSQKKKLQEDNIEMTSYVNNLKLIVYNQTPRQYLINIHIKLINENNINISNCDNDIDNANKNIIELLGSITNQLGENKLFGYKNVNKLEELEDIINNKLLTSKNKMTSIESTSEYYKLQILINDLDGIIKDKKQNDVKIANWNEFYKELSEYYDDLQE